MLDYDTLDDTGLNTNHPGQQQERGSIVFTLDCLTARACLAWRNTCELSELLQSARLVRNGFNFENLEGEQCFTGRVQQGRSQPKEISSRVSAA